MLQVILNFLHGLVEFSAWFSTLYLILSLLCDVEAMFFKDEKYFAGKDANGRSWWRIIAILIMSISYTILF